MRFEGLCAALTVLSVVCVAARVYASEPAKPQIDAPAIVLAEPDGATALGLSVGPSAALPQNAFVRVRGLPASMTLTDGYAVSTGTWAVPLFALANLMVQIPHEGSGRSNLTVQLVAIDGSVLAEVKIGLVVAPAGLIARAPTPAAGTPIPIPPLAHGLQPVSPPVPVGKPDRSKLEGASRPSEPQTTEPASGGSPGGSHVRTVEDRLRLEHLLAQGDRAFIQGNVIAARQFYQYVAGHGLALAAFKMAETFDPTELSRLPIVGLAPDPDAALRWYRLAADLGEGRSSARVRRLAGN